MAVGESQSVRRWKKRVSGTYDGDSKGRQNLATIVKLSCHPREGGGLATANVSSDEKVLRGAFKQEQQQRVGHIARIIRRIGCFYNKLFTACKPMKGPGAKGE